MEALRSGSWELITLWLQPCYGLVMQQQLLDQIRLVDTPHHES